MSGVSGWKFDFGHVGDAHQAHGSDGRVLPGPVVPVCVSAEHATVHKAARTAAASVRYLPPPAAAGRVSQQ